MASSRKGRRWALGLFLLGLGVLVVWIWLARGPLLVRWCRLRIDWADPAEQFDIARTLEEMGGPGRRAAENWYLELLRSWRPRPETLTARNPLEAVQVRVGDVQNEGFPRGPRAFHFPDEEALARAAERLVALRSLEAIPLLVEALTRSDPALPLTNEGFLTGPGSVLPSPRPVLALHFTASALYRLGKTSVPALVEAARSEKDSVRLQAICVLDRFGAVEEGASAAVLACLADSNPMTQQVARRYMERFDQGGARATLILLDIMRRARKPEIHRAASAAVFNLLGQNPHAERGLSEVLRDVEAPARAIALRYLAEHGEPISPRPQLHGAMIKLLGDENAAIRGDATRAIRRMRLQSAEVIDALARVLTEDTNDAVRHGAVTALEEFVPASGRALPAMRAALDDPHERVRSSARHALNALGGASAGR